MKKLAVALMSLLLLAGFVSAVWAQDTESPISADHLMRMGSGQFNKLAPGQYRAAVIDTVWYGFVTGGTPGTVGYYYPPGGFNALAKWDFDRKPDGTQATAGSVESWQGWTGLHTPYLSGGTRPPAQRPEFFLNYGNHPYSTNNYSFAAPYWHQQDMVAVPVRTGWTANQNLEGAGSLWCGMDKDVAAQVLHDYRTTPACSINFPGYGDLWDQYITHDVAISAGGTTMSFLYATDMDYRIDPTTLDTTTPLQNGSLYDALSVWVGTPTVALPYGSAIPTDSDIDDLLKNDATRNNLSATISGCTALDCLGWTGRSDSTGTLYTTTGFGGGLLGIGSQARVVFRVRTNTSGSDQRGTVRYSGAVDQPGGSKFGAAVVDKIYFSNAAGQGDGLGNGAGNAYTFNTAGNLQGWKPSGKVLPIYSKIINVGNNDPNVGGLFYDVGSPEAKYADACGVPGSITTQCNLLNNVLAQFDQNGTSPGTNPRDKYSQNWPYVNGEQQQATYSPPITLTGTPGFGRAGCSVQADIYAYLPITDAAFFWLWLRYQPGFNGTTPCGGTNPAGTTYAWSAWQRDPVIYYTDQPNCFVNNFEQSQLMPTTTVTYLQILVGTPVLCYAFGGGTGTCHANFSPLWDNIRVGMWNAPDAPAIVLFDWQFWQDAYPVDNSISPYLNMQKRRNAVGAIRANDPASADFYIKNIPVSSALIDAKTAVVTACVTNQVRPYTDNGRGVNQGDSVLVQSSFGARTARMDCVFRVLPGPLTNMADPFFTSYIANNGAYGTAGGHGGSWKWYVWNSVQMDTAEYDSWDSTANNALQGPGASPQYWATTIHENDVALRGVAAHNLPLVDPTAGPNAGAWLAENSGVPSTEHENIFPSYVFTPGTIIEYFYRSAYYDNLMGPNLAPDTNFVYSTGARYFMYRILPNAWADPTQGYGTPAWSGYGWMGGNGTGTITGAHNEVIHQNGRPCVLFVDHSFGLSQCYFSYHNTFDTLGIAPFVDDYTSQAPSSGETGIGNYEARLANATYTFVGSSGPSVKNLTGYGQIYYNSGVLGTSSLADGQNDGDANADVQLLKAWLETSGGRKGLWLNGTQIALSLNVQRPTGSPSRLFASDVLGIIDGAVDNGNALFNYRTISGDVNDCPTILAGNAPWNPAQQTAVTGNLCLYNYDVIPPRTDLATSFSSQVYAIGSLSAGVINDVAANPTGTSKTLIDALDFPRVRNVSCHDSYGRIYQMRTVYDGLFSDIGGRFCPDPVSPTAVQPGSGRFPNALFQNSPNPFRPVRATNIRYSVGRSSNVSLNVLDVSGRVVRSLVDGKKDAGEYSIAFDGKDANGASLASGVYFYRLKIGDFESNKKMLMLK
ncbi:MAG: T9SS type A sorting domain-containing protein [Candidatus Eisenbacteria bacterium]|nr:T9SS type A sorting domain-containing protein [Candidatus Eisenbacteria bacterium]